MRIMLAADSYTPLFKRSSVHTVLGDKRAAIADLTEVIRINPTLKQVSMLQLNLNCSFEDRSYP